MGARKAKDEGALKACKKAFKELKKTLAKGCLKEARKCAKGAGAKAGSSLLEKPSQEAKEKCFLDHCKTDPAPFIKKKEECAAARKAKDKEALKACKKAFKELKKTLSKGCLKEARKCA